MCKRIYYSIGCERVNGLYFIINVAPLEGCLKRQRINIAGILIVYQVSKGVAYINLLVASSSSVAKVATSILQKALLYYIELSIGKVEASVRLLRQRVIQVKVFTLFNYLPKALIILKALIIRVLRQPSITRQDQLLKASILKALVTISSYQESTELIVLRR